MRVSLGQLADADPGGEGQPVGRGEGAVHRGHAPTTPTAAPCPRGRGWGAGDLPVVGREERLLEDIGHKKAAEAIDGEVKLHEARTAFDHERVPRCCHRNEALHPGVGEGPAHRGEVAPEVSDALRGLFRWEVGHFLEVLHPDEVEATAKGIPQAKEVPFFGQKAGKDVSKPGTHTTHTHTHAYTHTHTCT